MSLKTERIKQPTVNSVVQPIYLGGTAEDGSDAPLSVSTAKVVNLASNSTIGGSSIPANIKSTLNATGSAPIYACRAWVNFNGTGTVAIRASGNVSSITDNGTGNYTINFTTAMPDTYYVVTGFSGLPTSWTDSVSLGSPSTANVGITTHTTTGMVDLDPVLIAIFR